MWLDLAVAFSCGGGGVVCGWVLHALIGFGNHHFTGTSERSAEGRQLRDEPNRERIAEVAKQLRDYAVSMAADVDAHQSRVQEVNNSLSGDLADASPSVVFDAVSQLIDANEAMQTQLQAAQERIHEQAVQIETAERRAQTDALTRIPNRRVFDTHLAERHHCRTRKPTTLALLDVDHFKQFNDVYGHRAGDEVLRIVAKVLHARLHRYGLVARIGGEEFAIILDDWEIEEAKQIVEETRIAIGERDIQFEGKRLRVAASVGVAELAEHESLEQWLQRADDGLYRSKGAGRNCGHWMDGHRAQRIDHCEQPADSNGSDEPPEEAIAQLLSDSTQMLSDATSVSQTGASVPLAEADGFEYLPDREVLGATFAKLRGSVESMSMFVMSVRSHLRREPGAMRTLLQIVRATLRSVDRIGCEDEGTLLVCMPSVDESIALERGRQIVRSLEAIQWAESEPGDAAVSIGLCPAPAGEDFGRVVERATELADQARGDGGEPIRVHPMINA